MNSDFKDQEEQEINLLSMLLSLMTHWRSLLIFAVIAIIAGIIAPNLGAAETEASVLARQQSMESVYSYYQVAENAREHVENSLYFRVDSNNAQVGTLKIFISAGGQTEEIAQRLGSVVSDSDFTADAVAAYGEDIEWQYLHEMISVSLDRSVGSGQDTADSTASVTVTIKETMPKQDQCTAILDVIRTYVNAILDEYADSDMNYIVLTDGVGVEVAADIRSICENQEAALEDYEDWYETALEALSEEDQALFKSIYVNGTVDKDTAFAEMGTSSFDIYVKWVVIAAFLGVVLWALLWIIPYLLSDCLRDSGEVRSFCTLPVLACVRTEGKKHTPIDRWIASLWTNAFGPYQSEEYLCQMLNLEGAPHIALSVSPTSAAQQALAEHVCAACPRVSRKESYHRSAQSIAELREGYRVIALVEIGATKRAELVSEIETLRRYGADIAGLVVID